MQSFFTRWWAEQSEETKGKVKGLVGEGRLSFMNGGWVQHDEAAAHYVAMIDQTTRGHRSVLSSLSWFHLCLCTSHLSCLELAVSALVLEAF